MKVAFFDTHRYDRAAFERANAGAAGGAVHDITFFEPRLTRETAALAGGHEAVCCFVNDRLDGEALGRLHAFGVRLVALRSAGYNHVDLQAAERLGLAVVRVPEYSPYAVAEHTVALLLALNRKIARAHARVRDWNFSLEGLVGFDLHGKTVGLVGTGRIGRAAAAIFRGFGCRVLAFDAQPGRAWADALSVAYVELQALYRAADVISLHVPLTPATHHMIDGHSLSVMKPGVVLLNTGRGALIDSRALIDALKRGAIGGAGLDVYEEEEGVFFRDLSDQVLQDDVLARLLTFPNVLVTAHQAFLTHEALAAIAEVTLASVTAFAFGHPLPNQVRARDVLGSAAETRK